MELLAQRSEGRRARTRSRDLLELPHQGAPAGPLFERFKAVICSGKARQADIAFYFLHWLTDLAGAEPTPLNGSDKFVLKFPRMVLSEFVQSFPIINLLATKSECEVYETYLIQRWDARVVR